jgi:glycosyltransferase involved in cell wall biosynthesis
MNPDLSVIMPSIRPDMLIKAYQSLTEAWVYPFEMIVVSPYALPPVLEGKPEIKYIQDWGNPNRAKQIGLVNATGKYVTWGVDDGVYLPNTLNDLYHTYGFNDVLTLKYLEGVSIEDLDKSDSIMKKDDYYNLSYHHHTLQGMPKDTKVLSFGIMPTRILKQIGGWDCEAFEGQAMADCDLAIRLTKMGHKITITPEMILVLKHVPGREGDHAPIHDSQIEVDEPAFHRMYSDHSNHDRTIIPLNNWEKSPARWTRRFNQEPLD